MPRVMRVLTRPNVGGPARQAVALWHEFAALGWQTLLVVGRSEDEADEPEIDLRAEGIPQVAVDAVDVASAGFVVLSTLRRGVHPLRDRLAFWRLEKLIEVFAPDVVHTHTSKAGALGRWAARVGRVPVVAHTFHGHVLQDYFGRWKSALVRTVERRLARHTRLLFAVSPSCRDELVAFGIAHAERIEVLPPAVDTRAFAAGSRAAARAELHLAPEAFVLGFVGRLVPIKRPEWFADVVTRIPDALGLVFGDGRLAERLAGRPRMRWLGATDRLAQWLPACDVLVFTSVREGCPLAAVEAFAAGVPVVGLAVPGVRDVLGAWGHGVLVDEGEGIDGLVAACEGLRDERRRAEIAARARASVGRFAPAAVARRMAELYAAELASVAGRPRRRWRNGPASWLDIALLVAFPVVELSAAANAVASIAHGTRESYLRLYGEAALLVAAVVVLAWWRAVAVDHRLVRTWMGAHAGLGVICLAVLAWSASRFW